MKELTLVFSADEKFFPLTGVMICSLLEHCTADRAIEIYILHRGLSSGSRNRLRKMTGKWTNVSVAFIDVSPFLRGYKLYNANRGDITVECYFRLLIPWLLSDKDKVLYLDGDMLAMDDIAPLYDIDLGDCLIAAVPDYPALGMYITDWLGQREIWDHRLKLQNPFAYFNSGLLVMNLALFRTTFDLGEVLAFAASQEWQFHDQDVLNVLCSGRTLLLEAKWNVLPYSSVLKRLPADLRRLWDEGVRSAKILHFAGYEKPSRVCGHPQGALFWEAARRTPFYRQLRRQQRMEVPPKGYVPLYPVWRDQYDRRVIKMVKHFLKKILPPPVNSFNREIERVIAEVRKQNETIYAFMKNHIVAQSARYGTPIPEKLVSAALRRGENGLNRITPHVNLRFEVDIVGHCNLNCRGCAHFSPLCKEEFADFEQVDRDFARLSELFGGRVEYLHLMGGEPLLHPRIKEFMASARRHFPVGRIEIVTNGLLLAGQDDAFWAACRENDILLSPTKYPISFNYEKVAETAAAKGVQLQFYSHSAEGLTFNTLPLDLYGEQDADESFMDCYMANACIFLSHGRLYPCSVVPHVKYFNAYFGKQLPVIDADSADIYAVQSADELMALMARPIPFCSYCNISRRTYGNTWKTTKREIREWTE